MKRLTNEQAQKVTDHYNNGEITIENIGTYHVDFYFGDFNLCLNCDHVIGREEISNIYNMHFYDGDLNQYEVPLDLNAKLQTYFMDRYKPLAHKPVTFADHYGSRKV